MNFNWNKILSSNETIQKEFGVSPKFLNALLVIVIVVSLIICFVAVPAGLLTLMLGFTYWFYLKKAKHYAITNKRFIVVDSFMGTEVVSIDLNQITDVEIEQSFFDQTGNWGTFIINTAGTHTPKINLNFVDNPYAIKQVLDQLKDAK